MSVSDLLLRLKSLLDSVEQAPEPEPNIRPQSQNLANKDSNQAHWTAFENVKGCIDFILSTVFAYIL